MKKILIASTVLMALAGCQIGTPPAPAPTPEAPAGNDQIRIESPLPNEVVTSPLEVRGEVRGYWMFEAIFDIRLEDAEGRELATGAGTATDDWMTENFVPFEATLTFMPGNATEGKLIFLEADPSGGMEGAQPPRTFEIPVRFAETQ